MFSHRKILARRVEYVDLTWVNDNLTVSEAYSEELGGHRITLCDECARAVRVRSSNVVSVKCFQ